MVKAPGHKRPIGSVPESAEQHREPQVAIGPPRPMTAAAQGDVYVVAQPRGQADVPAAPEVRGTDGQVRQVEVDDEFESQPPGDTARDPRVAREIAVDLERERIDANEDFPALREPAALRVYGKNRWPAIGAMLSAMTIFLNKPWRTNSAPLHQPPGCM